MDEGDVQGAVIGNLLAVGFVAKAGVEGEVAVVGDGEPFP